MDFSIIFDEWQRNYVAFNDEYLEGTFVNTDWFQNIDFFFKLSSFFIEQPFYIYVMSPIEWEHIICKAAYSLATKCSKQSVHKQTEQTSILHIWWVCFIYCIHLIPSCSCHSFKIRCNFENISGNLWCNFWKFLETVKKILEIFKKYENYIFGDFPINFTIIYWKFA